MHLLATALCVLCAASTLVATQVAAPGVEMPRLRCLDTRVETLLTLGLDRSATVRNLVSRIDAGRVLVYLEMRPTLGKGLSGQLSWVGDAGRYRYLRVALNPVQTTDELIAALAHELRHVVEVMDDPTVRGELSLQALYRRIGYASHGTAAAGWETEAARQTGALVRRELATLAARTTVGPAPARPRATPKR